MPQRAQLCETYPAGHCYAALVARVCKGDHLRCTAVPGSKIAHGHTAMLQDMLKDVRPHVQELKQRHRQVMQNMLMDMLRALATPNMDIRKKTLDIALDLINQHNIDEVTPAAWQHPVSASEHPPKSTHCQGPWCLRCLLLAGPKVCCAC